MVRPIANKVSADPRGNPSTRAIVTSAKSMVGSSFAAAINDRANVSSFDFGSMLRSSVARGSPFG